SYRRESRKMRARDARPTYAEGTTGRVPEAQARTLRAAGAPGPPDAAEAPGAPGAPDASGAFGGVGYGCSASRMPTSPRDQHSVPRRPLTRHGPRRELGWPETCSAKFK